MPLQTVKREIIKQTIIMSKILLKFTTIAIILLLSACSNDEIIEKNKGVEELVLVGIKRRGYPIAQRISEYIKSIEGIKVPVGYVDITLYRDDITQIKDIYESDEWLEYRNFLSDEVRWAKKMKLKFKNI